MVRLLALLALWAAVIRTSAADTDRQNAFETWTEKSDCRDSEGACHDWAEKGECDRNPHFMLQNCPLSCKRCQPPEISPNDYIGETLVLNCSLGQIRILPYFDRTPETCALVMELAHHPSACRGCNFYRNEAVPAEGSGPPYGLLQGSLSGLVRIPAREGPADVVMRRGHVALIPGTREFFVNVMDHDSWGASMTVWGELADAASMAVVESLLQLPYKEVKHPTYGTVMRLLEEHVAFEPLAVEALGAAAGEELGSL